MVTRPYNASIYIPFKITCTEQNCKVYRKTWQINPLVYILASGNLMGMVYEMSFLSRKLNTPPGTQVPSGARRCLPVIFAVMFNTFHSDKSLKTISGSTSGMCLLILFFCSQCLPILHDFPPADKPTHV